MPERESAPIYFLWKWKWSQIVNYFPSGMRYIENEELVHRDLAARNVLLDRNGVAKVKTKLWNDLFIHLIFLYLGATLKICNSWAYLGIFCLQVADFGLSKSKGEATDNDAFPILWSPPEVTTLNQFKRPIQKTYKRCFRFSAKGISVPSLMSGKVERFHRLSFVQLCERQIARSFGITMWEIFSFGEKPYNGMKHNDLKNFLKREERIAVSLFWNKGEM